MDEYVIDYQYFGGVVELQRGFKVPSETLLKAVLTTNKLLSELSISVPYIFELLQMRNLSALVGAAFCRELSSASAGSLRLNPHQDGYPDLLLMDTYGQELWDGLQGRHQEKDPFSPYVAGGIEIKVTCGEAWNAEELAQIGAPKLGIGDSRIDFIRSLNWKAHHRESNFLLGLVWDFYNGIPIIAAVLFSKELDSNDWGKVSTPKEGAGRTTSVSVMNRQGVGKMVSNQILILNDERYQRLLERFRPR